MCRVTLQHDVIVLLYNRLADTAMEDVLSFPVDFFVGQKGQGVSFLLDVFISSSAFARTPVGSVVGSACMLCAPVCAFWFGIVCGGDNTDTDADDAVERVHTGVPLVESVHGPCVTTAGGAAGQQTEPRHAGHSVVPAHGLCRVGMVRSHAVASRFSCIHQFTHHTPLHPGSY